jgi:hypothetical protein
VSECVTNYNVSGNARISGSGSLAVKARSERQSNPFNMSIYESTKLVQDEAVEV